MRRVFVDTSYFVAVVNQRDHLHTRALEVSRGLGEVELVTSEMVLVELLAFFARRGMHLRVMATRLCEGLADQTGVRVIPQTTDLFHRAVARYRQRADKDWSPVDCSSMVLMEEMGIDDVLTADHHFSQAGFKCLLGPTLP